MLGGAGIPFVDWSVPGRPGTHVPEFTIVHHTGGTFTSAHYVANVGRVNVPPPLYHILVYRDATVHLITEGRANQAGVGDLKVLEDIRADREPSHGVPSDGIFGGKGGNRYSYGVSMQGRGATHTPEQIAITKRVVVAIHVGMGWSHRIVRGHKEWTERKIDPELDMYAWRAETEGLMSMGRIEQELTDDQITHLIAKIKAETNPIGFNMTPTSGGHTVELLRALATAAGVSATDEIAIAAWIGQTGGDTPLALTPQGLINLMADPAVQATMAGVIGERVLNG